MRVAAVRVMTSEPPSNSSGMRLAKRCTLIPGFMLPPRLIAASTMNACPSKTNTSPATHPTVGSSEPQTCMLLSRKLCAFRAEPRNQHVVQQVHTVTSAQHRTGAKNWKPINTGQGIFLGEYWKLLILAKWRWCFRRQATPWRNESPL